MNPRLSPSFHLGPTHLGALLRWCCRWLLPLVLALVVGKSLARAQFLGRSVAEWAADLDRGDDKSRRNAAFALGKLGAQALPALPFLKKAAAHDSNPRVRESAVFALGEIGQRALTLTHDPEVLPLLTKSLQDGDPMVRRSAAFALGSLGGDAKTSRRALEDAFRDDRPEVRQSVAWALGRLGDETVPTLRRALADGDTLVLRDAAGSLAQIDPNVARAALKEVAALCKHRDVEVKKNALLCMVGIVLPEDAKASTVFGPLQQALLDADEEVRRNAAFALSNIGGATAAPAVDVLLEALKRGDVKVKRQAAAALRNIGPHADKAVDELSAALRDPDVELRGFAALALGGIGKRAESAVAALAGMVTNKAEPVENRVEAAVALSLIGNVPPAIAAAPRLLEVATDPRDDGKVRERVLWSLRVHNIRLRDMPGVYDAFLKILREPGTADNRMVRYDSAYLMGMIFGPKAPPETFTVLLEYLKDETIQVYRNKAILVQGAGQETTTGKTSSRELGEGDGRRLALESIESIGPATIRQQPAIVEQIRRIAADERVFAGFRQQCRDFLKLVGS